MTNRILWIVMAVLAIAGGIYALVNPFAASVAATIIAGWMFLLSGAFELAAGVRAEGTGVKIWTVLLGALAMFVGITILGHPLKGMIALTSLVAILFLAGGISKLILAFSMEERQFFWVVVLSGVASLALGIIILANWPVSAATSLGILLGIELISNGIAALVLALSRDAQEVAET